MFAWGRFPWGHSVWGGGWVLLVTDRAAVDVTRAEYLAAKGWEKMTEPEKAEWLAGMKGAYNYTDLNRVGAVAKYLADTLDMYGYAVTVSPKTDWVAEDIPKASDVVKYLADMSALKDGFYGTTPLPDSMEALGYEDANNIERLLAEINENINRMISGFRKCGTFKAGQGVILP